MTTAALVEHSLARKAEVVVVVQAWLHGLADVARAATRAMGAKSKADLHQGPRRGLPVATRDVIDVECHPTRTNTRGRADTASVATYAGQPIV